MKKHALTAVDDALECILRGVSGGSTGIEVVAMSEASGRIIADTINAEINVPGYDNSAMDGFAVNTDFIKKPGSTLPITLPISQVIPAGLTGAKLESDTAARIFTGAPIPLGANAVILQEDTEYDDQQVKVKQVPKAGQNIRLCGHDIKQGDVILEQGHKLLPQDIGLLASLGLAKVKVYKPLKIAILNTGDELVAPGENLKAGQIYESNSFTLDALLKKMGMQTQKLGIVKDDLQSTQQALLRATEDADCIMSSGGVSVGDADYIKTAVENLGKLSLWKLAIKPGKPFSFGQVGETPFFGLPGNPVAVFVTFLMLVKPYLLKMQGAQNIHSEKYLLPAGFEVAEVGSRQEYLRVCLQGNQQGKQELIPFLNQGSSVMTSTSWADGLAIIPINTRIERGDLLEFLPYTGLL
ncbi:MAG: molybdopterin molybdenumtransferase MoeA [SAR86 cluster bacterium]|uniref:Molybdopterin molybdenumtransferase n=1 Tax=SAR86 cluster bacterium TaxID=2030880 RepID=A0A2A5CCR8_9GAMM|nr:molybdopterin molybdotransferase MoeA [Gammaproteobacteria bacterium AH-315-E17]PCJ41684.1 MAG: molybdopterin molybdenumtransferase MoeA [SAR86 cluster bacterium]